MEIFFNDPNDIPVPKEKVRIREFTAQPYPDGRRIRVSLDLTPFMDKPDATISLLNSDGETVTSAAVIETITPKLEMTLHLPAGADSGEYTLRTVVFYRIELPSEDGQDDPQPDRYEVLEVDKGEVQISIP